jgi:hypothetical protein
MKSEPRDSTMRRSGKPVSPPSNMAPIAPVSNMQLHPSGEMVIHNMRATRPAYNIISNNCQNFAVLLLDAIKIGAHKEFATSFAVYQAATGAGQIKDLFVDQHPEEQQDQQRPTLHHQDTTQNAQQVMEDNTTKLDNHQSSFFSSVKDRGSSLKDRGLSMFSRGDSPKDA